MSLFKSLFEKNSFFCKCKKLWISVNKVWYVISIYFTGWYYTHEINDRILFTKTADCSATSNKRLACVPIRYYILGFPFTFAVIADMKNTPVLFLSILISIIDTFQQKKFPSHYHHQEMFTWKIIRYTL